MERNCKNTCGLCPPPGVDLVPEVEPIPQADNDNCLADEMNRIADYNYDDYDYDDYYYDDYEDEACASVQDYLITIKNRKYSTYDAHGSCKVSKFHFLYTNIHCRLVVEEEVVEGQVELEVAVEAELETSEYLEEAKQMKLKFHGKCPYIDSDRKDFATQAVVVF